MSFHTPYRWCIVPNCKNTTLKTPEKLFNRVPNDFHMGNIWLELSGRDPSKLSTKSLLHLCEDHFNVSIYRFLCRVVMLKSTLLFYNKLVVIHDLRL